jgi:hypothetical protein
MTEGLQNMRKQLIVAGLAAALLVPAGAEAKPSRADRQNASKQCRAERGTSSATREAFAQKYGTNESKSNAFGKCVSQKTREEHRERHAAARSASRECRAERSELGRQAFAEKYGTNRNKRNAFGKCVSGKARAAKREMDAEDREDRAAQRNAARQCAEERGTTSASRGAFAQKYGTNQNRRNAFGKCVAQKASASS